MKKILIIFFVCMSLSTIVFSAEELSIIEGRIDLIEPGHITMSTGIKYQLVNPDFDKNLEADSYDFETTYWISDRDDPYQVDFNALAGVGYADKARITLQNNIVKKIEILDMQQ